MIDNSVYLVLSLPHISNACGLGRKLNITIDSSILIRLKLIIHYPRYSYFLAALGKSITFIKFLYPNCYRLPAPRQEPSFDLTYKIHLSAANPICDIEFFQYMGSSLRMFIRKIFENFET